MNIIETNVLLDAIDRLALHAPEAFTLLQLLAALDAPAPPARLADALGLDPCGVLLLAQRLCAVSVRINEAAAGLSLADPRVHAHVRERQLPALTAALRARFDATATPALDGAAPAGATRVDGAALLGAPALPLVEGPPGGLDGGALLGGLDARPPAERPAVDLMDAVWLRPAPREEAP